MIRRLVMNPFLRKQIYIYTLKYTAMQTRRLLFGHLDTMTTGSRRQLSDDE